jgi:hypothetical protein
VAFTGKAALFVEGEFTPKPRTPDPLGTIWQRHLVTSLGLIEIDRIVPINKKNLVAMDKAMMRKLSGAGMMGLDRRIAVELERADFDVAVIAWDLKPAWDPSAKTCRWNEVLNLYRGLSESKALPDEPWRRWARDRYHELRGRKNVLRKRPTPSLETGAVLAVCMEPTFESLLVVCEKTIRRALGVKNGGRVKWPTWDEYRERPEDLLQLAIEAAERIRPKPEAIKHVRGDMKNAKNEWGEYLLRHMIQDEHCLEEIRQHPTAARLVDLLSKDRPH